MNSFFNWYLASQKSSMSILQSLSATVLSITNDYLYTNIVIMEPSKMHFTVMTNIVLNFHGMNALRLHSVLQGL